MPVAKYLSYTASRSRTGRARQIDGFSFVHPRALQQQTSSPQPAIAAISVASRSILRTTAQYADSVGDTALVIASWMLMQIFAGCLAYAIATYGIPQTALRKEPGGPKRPAPPAPPRNSSRLQPYVISIDAGDDIRADKISSLPEVAQPCANAQGAELTPAARSAWRNAIITPVVLLLSKIREGYARRRMVAELQELDERSLRDIGISRADIGYILRHRTRPE